LLLRRGSLAGTWNRLFRDHEIYIRTNGDVRFLRLSATMQRRAAIVLLLLLAGWLAVTLGLIGWQAWTSWQTRDVASRAVAVEQAEARVAAERRSVESIARSLDARQDNIEALFKAHFGADPVPDAAPQTAPEEPGAAVAAPASAPKPDQVGQLEAIGERQARLVEALTAKAEQRVARAEEALQTVGLRAGRQLAQGGPFRPYDEAPAAAQDPALKRLASTLERMEQLEALLVALPSDLPTEGMELSSGFGFRFDPFTGARAMHSGLDFRGAHRTPIRTAAAGRVSFAGVQNGYGNVVEVDHGHGLKTRYAHLAAFVARPGQPVSAGDVIALMGSTGRSTGTHLHFEVLVNGTAVNPRRFLEANPHVLEVKADAGSRLRDRVSAS
jgi:murein DD-endopeptidase MepM/ murein hydrolase activator NlpD